MCVCETLWVCVRHCVGCETLWVGVRHCEYMWAIVGVCEPFLMWLSRCECVVYVKAFFD